MDTPIVFTPSQLIGVFLAACGLITAVGAAGAVVVAWINKLKAPNKLQDQKIEKHEEWLKRHDTMLTNDNNRLKNLEEGTNITLKALLALLRHGIDGNDIEGMRKVRDELQQYLIDERGHGK